MKNIIILSGLSDDSTRLIWDWKTANMDYSLYVYAKNLWNFKDQSLNLQIKWKIVGLSSTANSFNGRCNLCEKISIINFEERIVLWNKPDELLFKCRHISIFKLSWVGATEAPIQDNSRDIDAGWFLVEIRKFISIVNCIIWRGDLCRGGDSWKFKYV